MMNWLAGCALMALVLGLGACKGKTEIRDNPETLKALEACRDTLNEKAKYAKDLEARVFDLEQEGGDQVVVEITGDTMTIRGKGPSERSGGPAAADEELFESFLSQVQGARGQMQRCYQNALKKNSGLQARTITLNVQVRFSPAGKVARATFEPEISDAFEACMSAVARRWTLDGTSQSVTFRQPITLSPQ